MKHLLKKENDILGLGVWFLLIDQFDFFFLSGVLLRKLEAGIRGISHVIVDEIHERDINVSGPPDVQRGRDQTSRPRLWRSIIVCFHFFDPFTHFLLVTEPFCMCRPTS